MNAWACEAYGADVPAPLVGVCFVEAAQPRCPGPRTCHAVMTLERQRLWDRLHQQAYGPDPDAAAVARQVLAGLTGPDELLGGAE